MQVKADLTQAIAALAKLGFPSTRSINSSYGTDCEKTASGGVKQFLTRHPCKEYASAILTARRQGTTARVAISWVVMPTANLAEQYEAKANVYGQGNPPGEPPMTFNGHCYASHQNDATVWAEQVQPTGHVNADREILQAAAPAKLTLDYLHKHCVG